METLPQIEEDEVPGMIPASLPSPETPTETMEFLARSWSLSAIELSTALGNINPPARPQPNQASDAADPLVIRKNMAHCSFAQTGIKIRFLQSHHSSFAWFQFLRGPTKAKTMSGWLKDHKQRRRVEARTRSAQIYAATSVAGVAAVVAATAAGSFFSLESNQNRNKTSAAIASAAALVASHCVDMAQAIGATQDQILPVIQSAVNAQTTGDIMALTAGAATALRAAAILSARLQKETNGGLILGEGRELDGCLSAQTLVSRGEELLKRTRKGDLHWKHVCVYINSNWKVILKMKSTHMGGTFVKKKKGVVVEVCSDIPAWPGREVNGNSEKGYFGIRTSERLFEFECRNKCEKKMWVNGIQQILKFRANMNTSMAL